MKRKTSPNNQSSLKRNHPRALFVETKSPQKKDFQAQMQSQSIGNSKSPHHASLSSWRNQQLEETTKYSKTKDEELHRQAKDFKDLSKGEADISPSPIQIPGDQSSPSKSDQESEEPQEGESPEAEQFPTPEEPQEEKQVGVFTAISKSKLGNINVNSNLIRELTKSKIEDFINLVDSINNVDSEEEEEFQEQLKAVLKQRRKKQLAIMRKRKGILGRDTNHGHNGGGIPVTSAGGGGAAVTTLTQKTPKNRTRQESGENSRFADYSLLEQSSPQKNELGQLGAAYYRAQLQDKGTSGLHSFSQKYQYYMPSTSGKPSLTNSMLGSQGYFQDSAFLRTPYQPSPVYDGQPPKIDPSSTLAKASQNKDISWQMNMWQSGGIESFGNLREGVSPYQYESFHYPGISQYDVAETDRMSMSQQTKSQMSKLPLPLIDGNYHSQIRVDMQNLGTPDQLLSGQENLAVFPQTSTLSPGINDRNLANLQEKDLLMKMNHRGGSSPSERTKTEQTFTRTTQQKREYGMKRTSRNTSVKSQQKSRDETSNYNDQATIFVQHAPGKAVTPQQIRNLRMQTKSKSRSKTRSKRHSEMEEEKANTYFSDQKIGSDDPYDESSDEEPTESLPKIDIPDQTEEAASANATPLQPQTPQQNLNTLEAELSKQREKEGKRGFSFDLRKVGAKPDRNDSKELSGASNLTSNLHESIVNQFQNRVTLNPHLQHSDEDTKGQVTQSAARSHRDTQGNRLVSLNFGISLKQRRKVVEKKKEPKPKPQTLTLNTKKVFRLKSTEPPPPDTTHKDDETQDSAAIPTVTDHQGETESEQRVETPVNQGQLNKLKTSLQNPFSPSPDPAVNSRNPPSSLHEMSFKKVQSTQRTTEKRFSKYCSPHPFILEEVSRKQSKLSTHREDPPPLNHLMESVKSNFHFRRRTFHDMKRKIDSEIALVEQGAQIKVGGGQMQSQANSNAVFPHLNSTFFKSSRNKLAQARTPIIGTQSQAHQALHTISNFSQLGSYTNKATPFTSTQTDIQTPLFTSGGMQNHFLNKKSTQQPMVKTPNTMLSSVPPSEILPQSKMSDLPPPSTRQTSNFRSTLQNGTGRSKFRITLSETDYNQNKIMMQTRYRMLQKTMNSLQERQTTPHVSGGGTQPLMNMTLNSFQIGNKNMALQKYYDKSQLNESLNEYLETEDNPNLQPTFDNKRPKYLEVFPGFRQKLQVIQQDPPTANNSPVNSKLTHHKSPQSPLKIQLQQQPAKPSPSPPKMVAQTSKQSPVKQPSGKQSKADKYKAIQKLVAPKLTPQTYFHQSPNTMTPTMKAEEEDETKPLLQISPNSKEKINLSQEYEDAQVKQEGLYLQVVSDVSEQESRNPPITKAKNALTTVDNTSPRIMGMAEEEADPLRGKSLSPFTTHSANPYQNMRKLNMKNPSKFDASMTSKAGDIDKQKLLVQIFENTSDMAGSKKYTPHKDHDHTGLGSTISDNNVTKSASKTPAKKEEKPEQPSRLSSIEIQQKSKPANEMHLGDMYRQLQHLRQLQMAETMRAKEAAKAAAFAQFSSKREQMASYLGGTTFIKAKPPTIQQKLQDGKQASKLKKKSRFNSVGRTLEVIQSRADHLNNMHQRYPSSTLHNLGVLNDKSYNQSKRVWMEQLKLKGVFNLDWTSQAGPSALTKSIRQISPLSMDLEDFSSHDDRRHMTNVFRAKSNDLEKGRAS